MRPAAIIALFVLASVCALAQAIEEVGFDARDRATLDTAKQWTMVSKAAFSKDGEVKEFELYSGAANRALRVGIYRPSGGDCGFELVQQKEWKSFPVGLNKIKLTGADVFKVKAGDRYGFTWLNYGVIDFDYVSTENYCELPAAFSVGQQANLVANRHGKRDYSIRMKLCVAASTVVGFDARDRGTLDTAKQWTMVSKAAFSTDGEVSTFELFSGAANRALRVGIYRPSGGDCGFELVQQKEWKSFPVGLNKVQLTGADVFKVKAGDRYGFTWLNYGVIDFDYVSNDNYCELPAAFSVGQQANLVSNRHGKRDYSIRMMFRESVGFDAKDRKALDTAKQWTMVSTAAFSKDGKVNEFELYSGAANRALRVGIYRPSGSGCAFQLVQQKEWTSFPVGLNKVQLTGADVFKVKAGDRYGFTWLKYGVIDFDFVSTANYCELPAAFSVGQKANLVANRHGKRDYSIRMKFSDC